MVSQKKQTLCQDLGKVKEKSKREVVQIMNSTLGEERKVG